jgi:predicted RNA-binding Zn-ribbon protein involved in translation (DUF1610 family)
MTKQQKITTVCSSCKKTVTVDWEEYMKGYCPECGSFFCHDCIEAEKVCEHMKRLE